MKTIDLDQASTEELLLLRLALQAPDIDPPRIGVAPDQIEMDIRDLFQFPERLDGSYQAEWRSTIRNRLNQKLRQYQQQHPDVSLSQAEQGVLEALHDERMPQVLERYASLFRQLRQAEQARQDPSVAVFPSPLRQLLDKLLS